MSWDTFCWRLLVAAFAAVTWPGPAAAQIPPPNIQAILQKQQSGQRLTEEEAKALVAWSQSLSQMFQGGAGPSAGPGATPSALNIHDEESATAALDGRAIWESELWPVFSHPRCINCHGLVNPVTGENHGGGRIPGVETTPNGGIRDALPCFQCHTAGATWYEEPKLFVPEPTAAWELPPRDMWFAGRSSTEVCARISKDIRSDPSSLVRHFQEDPRIKLGFVGLRGMDERSPAWDVVQPAEPPPLTHEQFLAALRKWVQIGGGSCGWTGTITYVRKEITDQPLPSGTYHEESEVETRLDVTANHATGTARFTGNSRGQRPAHLMCTLANGTGQVALPLMGSKQAATETTSGTANDTGTVRVVRTPDGRYSLNFPIFRIPVSSERTLGAPDRPTPNIPSNWATCTAGGSETSNDVHSKSRGSLKGSGAPNTNRLSGSVSKTTTDPDGTTLTITGTWDLHTP